MKSLMTPEERAKLLDNGRQAGQRLITNPWPVVMLSIPNTPCAWLLSELDPEEPDIAFGLCDVGKGCPRLGTVNLWAIRYRARYHGQTVIRNPAFQADRGIEEYAKMAREAGRIILSENGEAPHAERPTGEPLPTVKALVKTSMVLSRFILQNGWTPDQMTPQAFSEKAADLYAEARIWGDTLSFSTAVVYLTALADKLEEHLEQTQPE